MESAARKVGRRAESETRKAGHTARHAAASPWVEGAAPVIVVAGLIGVGAGLASWSTPGRLLLFAVGAGFVALALHSFANARWVRMLRPK